MEDKKQIKVGKVKYNESNPENLSIDQAYQYIDDTTSEETIEKEINAIDMNKYITGRKKVRMSIFYWLHQACDFKYISEVERDFLKLIFDGVSHKLIFKLTKQYIPNINKLADISKCRDILLDKVRDAIGEIQIKSDPLYPLYKTKIN